MYHLTPGKPIAALPGSRFGTAYTSGPNGIRRLLKFIGRRGWLFALTTGAVVLLVGVGSFLIPKRYTAQVRLIAGNSSAQPARAGDTALPILNALIAQTGVQTAATYAELLQERPVAEEVLRRAHVDATPEMLLARTTVAPINTTPILRVSVTWTDREQAVRLANLLGDVFIERERALVASQASQALALSRSQLPAAAQRLGAADRALSRYQARHGLADVAAQTQTAVTSLAAIDQKISQAEVEREHARAQLDSTLRDLAATSPSIALNKEVAQNPVAPQLQTQLATVEVQLGAARKRYSEEHPTVIHLREEEAQLQRQIAAAPRTIVARTNTAPHPLYEHLRELRSQYRSQVLAASAELGRLQRQRSELLPRIATLPAQNSAIASLQRERKLAEDVYTSLQQRYNDAMLGRTTALSDVTMTQPATLGSVAVAPNLRTNLFLALIAGAMLGAIAMVLLELIDNRVKDGVDVTREYGMPQLAAIPRMPKGGSDTSPAIADAATTEAFVDLVTSIRYSSDRRIQVIAMLSPGEDEGKTTMCMNTAIAFADIAPRVVIVDADMRAASLHSMLGIPRGRGLSDVLVGPTALDDVIVRTKHPAIDLVTAGTSVPNPATLLQSRSFEELLDELRRRYNTVIFDCTAVNPVVDAALVGTRADGSVLVLAQDETEMRAVGLAFQRLESVGVNNVLGFVLNFASRGSHNGSGAYLAAAANAEAPQTLVLES
jgi:succinoglycan biosynthesis transport protein ExoP